MDSKFFNVLQAALIMLARIESSGLVMRLQPQKSRL